MKLEVKKQLQRKLKNFLFTQKTNAHVFKHVNESNVYQFLGYNGLTFDYSQHGYVLMEWMLKEQPKRNLKLQKLNL